MRLGWSIPLLALLAGCGEADQPAPVQSEAAVPSPAGSPTATPSAALSASGAPAAKQLVLEPITQDYAAEHDLMGVGCTFSTKDSKQTDWFVQTSDGDAHFKTGGTLIHLTAPVKAGEAFELARDRYDSADYSLHIDRGPGEERIVGEESTEQEGSVAIRDKSGAEVYRAKGMFGCGA